MPRRLCSGPPVMPTNIDMDSNDLCYLYRAIDQNETELAKQWIGKWGRQSINEKSKQCAIIWSCLQMNNEILLDALLSHKLVLQEDIAELRNQKKQEERGSCGNHESCEAFTHDDNRQS
jgi:hypothetical protein